LLNYVWLGLLVIGITAALVTDINDNANNKFRNNEPFEIIISFPANSNELEDGEYNVDVIVSAEKFNKFYSTRIKSNLILPAIITLKSKSEFAPIVLQTEKAAPPIWIEMAGVSGGKNDLIGKVNLKEQISDKSIRAEIIFEDVSFLKLKDVTDSALSYAGTAVEIALGLIGIMALWLGVMKVAEEAGLIRIIARILKPITKKLFPDIPSDHPAMGSIIMNISANMLGLGNAATPFGLKAMEEMNTLNPNKGTATNSMVTFLAINTAGFALIPATAIAVRAAAGSSNPAIIIGTTIFGAACATIAGITAAKIIEKFYIKSWKFSDWIRENARFLFIIASILIVLMILFLSGFYLKVGSMFSFISAAGFKGFIEIVSVLAIPLMILVFIGYGALKKIKVFESFVEGAKEGFNIAVKIIPYLVAMLIAIGIFRAGGAMDWLIYILSPVTNFIGMPAEVLPMALMRPLSGSGSLGIMVENLNVYGPDSFIGILVSTIYGSTETTFYVLAVYFGAVNIKNTRHALPVGLIADVAGILGALFIVKLLFS